MPRVDLLVSSPLVRTTRVKQLEGMFDVPAHEKLSHEWRGELPIENRAWNIGLIVGPSGCGKSTIMQHLFESPKPFRWTAASVIDDFDEDLSIHDIASACSSVGFNTIPSWMKPYAVLSTGEKFRVGIARSLLERDDPIVIDEFTSVVDRQVALIILLTPQDASASVSLRNEETQMSNAFAAAHFQNDEAARNLIETVRWPDGPICSHCGAVNHAYAVKGRAGLYRCAEPECRKDFTVTTGTVMERSKIPLHKWMMAFYLMNASKKSVSSHQLHRALGITYQAAWFMTHRIREAMRDGGFTGPLGGEGEIVEADETYYGPIDKAKVRTKTTSGRPFTKSGKGGPSNKRPIVALVERGGSVRTFHVPVADKATVNRIVRENIARESKLHTDESRLYNDALDHVAEHKG